MRAALAAVTVALAVALAVGVPGPDAAAGRPEDGPGRNPACFRSAHEQPTSPPGEGSHFGGRLWPYLEVCRGEIRRP